jgi:hypothetical protein
VSSYPRNGRKGTRSSPVTRVAAVTMAAELCDIFSREL